VWTGLTFALILLLLIAAQAMHRRGLRGRKQSCGDSTAAAHFSIIFGAQIDYAPQKIEKLCSLWHRLVTDIPSLQSQAKFKLMAST
jgi:hypothetical protein